MNTSFFALAGLGLLLGFRHALEPDHLAAVSTLATRQGKLLDACRLGVAGAVGHSLNGGGVGGGTPAARSASGCCTGSPGAPRSWYCSSPPRPLAPLNSPTSSPSPPARCSGCCSCRSHSRDWCASLPGGARAGQPYCTWARRR